jgi:beta-galactosidase
MPKNLEKSSSPSVDKTPVLNMGIRERIKMNAGWKFHFGELEGEDPTNLVFEDGTWEQVHLPHDFVAGELFTASPEVQKSLPSQKTGWYRKTFEVPISDKGKNLWIDLDGICGKSTFWFNGLPLGTRLNCHSGIHFEITDFVRYGEKNVLTIHVDAQLDTKQWYEGGGIYRHAWLNKSDYLRVAPLGIFVSSSIPVWETSLVKAEIEIRTKILNGFQSALSFTILSEIQDAQGKTVLSFSDSRTVGINTFAEVVQKVKLDEPILWSLEKPHLYRLVTRLEREGEIVDGVTTPFGIRSIRFDENHGFFLNERSIKIKGTCNYQDFVGVGIALPDKIISYQLEKLIEMGSNAYRSSGHPPSIEFLNECDRLGLLVIDERARFDEAEEVISQLEIMVLRDRNHPCIILWSLCNEEARGMEVLRMGDRMKQAVLKNDRTRLVTCPINFEDEVGLTKVIDVQGVDYNISQYDPFHISHPSIPIYGNKIAGVVSTRGIYENHEEKGYKSTYDVNHSVWGTKSETAWKAVAERAFVFGGFVWTGFDYRGESDPIKELGINSQTGFMDICGFPKDSYYYYQSWWSDKKVLHLFPHWNWQTKEGQEIDVWCYSNCESVELLLNEKSLGVKKMPQNGHLEWKVKYHTGSLRAVGIQSGKVIMENVVETASAPVKVHLKPYRLEMMADGEDVIPVEIEILDWKNRLVPLAQNEVIFSLKGPGKIVGIGNGDPSNRESDKFDRRKAFNGRCMALVRTIEKPGEIKLTVKSPGLRYGSVTFKSF